MEHSNTTHAKIPILDTGKFEQWKFRIQQYLQNEHYALWDVIEFGDSYEVPKEGVATGSASDGKKGRTVAVTTKDMQKRRNDVKARTTLLLALPDEHQLRFSKYKSAQELWAAILKTFGGNEATRKTKKNLLKQQYGNFKAEGKEMLEQTFKRLQAIISQLEFMDVEIEQDDLNQKLLTSLAPEWLMHTIVYELEVQKKSDSQNMAFISSSKNSSRNEEVNTASVPTARTQVFLTGANVAPASISLDTACAYTASQSNGKKIFIQGTDVAGFDKSKVECFNCHKISHFARECRAPRSQDRGKRDNYRQGSKNHALVADEEAPTEFALMAKTSVDSEAVDPPTVAKSDKKVTVRKPFVKYAKLYRKSTKRNSSELIVYGSENLGSFIRCFDPSRGPKLSDMGNIVSGIESQSIPELKARVKLLEDREGGGIAQFGEDAPIKGRSLNQGEEAAI
nr:hypothetical protein [Tanacetum cinerariifolium]